jgi:formate-dependent nitrite reductase membrane component NrfD
MMEIREFILGPRQQREWRWLVIVALFLTGIEAGLFLLALIARFVLGMVAGVIFVLAGGLSVLADLSRHRAAWRLLARPQGPWMSRGTIQII